jgi:hypothetical protein
MSATHHGASVTEVQRWALDAGDWLWGMVRGAFNEKQTTSQIIVDAVIGMIPVVGDVTAVRDLIAVSIGMSQSEHKRNDKMQWVLLVVLLFALIPVFGGVIKGVGRLLLKLGAEAAHNHVVIEEIVRFLNRVGHGNQMKWFKELDFTKYQSQIIGKFNALMDKLIEAMRAIQHKLGWFIPKSMADAIHAWIARFQYLKAMGDKMIPEAIKDLNLRLKKVQQAIYKGELHTASAGTKTTTRETEGRLLEHSSHVRKRPPSVHPSNTVADYKHVEGWPRLDGYFETGKNGKRKYVNIEAFSGPMRAVELKPGDVIFRVLLPAKNSKTSPWWTTKMPRTAEEWREFLAVLDKFNANNFFMKYTIPHGASLKAWKGKAAEQWDAATGQFLKGGGEQLFIEFPVHIKAELLQLSALSTGWGKTLKLFGFEKPGVVATARVERLGANEVQSKR